MQAITGLEFSRKATMQGATSRHTGSYEWRTCPRSRSLRGEWIRTNDLLHRRPPFSHHTTP